MDASIVTVNFKTADYLERMLASLFEKTRGCEFEVFVVENASGDDLSALEARFPSVKFIYSQSNLGFAGGCNLAIREAAGDFVILVNPDVVFTSDAISAVVSKMRANENVGIGGISLKNPDGTQQACVWRFPRPSDQLLLLLKAHHVFKHLRPINRWLCADFDYAKTADVDQVMGAFFCIRRELFERIGPLDDGFFMWYEEVDFCKRAKDAGWQVRYFADISVEHKKGSSFERVATIKKQKMIRRSLRRYMRKHFGLGAWLLFTLPEPLYVLLAVIASVIKPK